MNGTALISGIRKEFRDGFKHTKILIAKDQTYTGKIAFFEPYKEGASAFMLLFLALSSAKNLPVATLTDANGNKYGKPTYQGKDGSGYTGIEVLRLIKQDFLK